MLIEVLYADEVLGYEISSSMGHETKRTTLYKSNSMSKYVDSASLAINVPTMRHIRFPPQVYRNNNLNKNMQNPVDMISNRHYSVTLKYRQKRIRSPIFVQFVGKQSSSLNILSNHSPPGIFSKSKHAVLVRSVKQGVSVLCRITIDTDISAIFPQNNGELSSNHQIVVVHCVLTACRPLVSSSIKS